LLMLKNDLTYRLSIRQC